MSEKNMSSTTQLGEVKAIFKTFIPKLNTIPLRSSEGIIKPKTEMIDINATSDGFEVRLRTYELKIAGEEDDDNNDDVLESELITKLSELVSADGRFQIIDSYGSEKGYWYFLVKYI